MNLRQTVPNEGLPYSCLSYCWGGDQPVKTTKATLDDRIQGIDYASFLQTLQDAIRCSLQLNIPYIWIDCLCIIQDDEDDLVTELPQMPNIRMRIRHNIYISCE